MSTQTNCICHKTLGYEPDDIKLFIKIDERYGIGIKPYTIHQLSLGVASRNLEELYHTSLKQIQNQAHRFEAGGVEKLMDKKDRGRKTGLIQEKLERLRNLITSKIPTNYRYNTESWTVSLIMNWVRKTFEIEYKKVQI